MKISPTFFIAVLVLFNCCTNEPAIQQQESTVSQIDDFVTSMVEQFDVPGVAIAVTRNDSILFSKAYGFKNTETNEKLAVNHFFHFASVSKTFVAAAIMQLVEKGKINLDDKLIDYLPYFRLKDSRYREITIKQVLNHTSGLGDVNDYEWGNPSNGPKAIEDFVKDLVNEELLFEPGSDWSYSNTGFNILGDLIEKVSGEPFEKYVARNIFEPLEMDISSFIYPEIPEELRTSPHTWNGAIEVSKVYPYNRVHTASGTLNSSVEEMAKWALFYLKNDSLDKRTILTSESRQILWSKSMNLSDRPEIGLSWFIGEHRDRRSIWHGGRDLGYTSYLVLLPEENISVIVASNYQLSPIDWLANGTLDILLGYQVEKYRHHIGFELYEKIEEEGIKAARSFYDSILNDSLKMTNYLMDSDGIIPVANFVKNNGSKEVAKALFEFNVELNLESTEALNDLGSVLIELNLLTEAKDVFNKVVELDNENEYAKMRLSEINMK